MTITTLATALKAAMNRANANDLPDMLRTIALGSWVRAMPVPIRGLVPAAGGVDPWVNATAQSFALPDDAKAALIHRAYARSGTGTLGPLVIDTPDPTGAAAQPAASHCAISPNGDLVFNAADAWTSVDVLYLPEKFDMQEITLPVVANVLTLPTVFGLALVVCEVQATVGGSVGNKIVDAPGTAVAAGHAAFNLAKTTVVFAAGDAVTQARVKFAAASAVDVNALLEAVSVYL